MVTEGSSFCKTKKAVRGVPVMVGTRTHRPSRHAHADRDAANPLSYGVGVAMMLTPGTI